MTRVYVHPLPVRIWHWVNAAGFVVLILTGLHIRYADLFQVVSYATAINIHNSVGFALIANVPAGAVTLQGFASQGKDLVIERTVGVEADGISWVSATPIKQ